MILLHRKRCFFICFFFVSDSIITSTKFAITNEDFYNNKLQCLIDERVYVENIITADYINSKVIYYNENARITTSENIEYVTKRK